LDIDPRVVDAVNAAREPFPGEHDLGRYLENAVGAGNLRATSDPGELAHADVVVIVVPLLTDPDTGQPDFAIMDAATASVGANLKSGALVIYETTLPVGTTRTRWIPALEAASGLSHGVDFDVVFSPERVLTGRVFADLRRYPKLVGAFSAAAVDKARAFYEAALEFDDRPDLDAPNGVWDLGSPEAAELAKLAETTYRDVNIALANEFARFAQGAGFDIYAVVRASNSQPYSHIHKPGIAVGGHCIPVYPKLYLAGDPDAAVVRTARELNESMPAYAVGLLADAMGALSGTRVAVMGAAYRGGVKETAVSGVFPVVQALKDAGATPVVHDPLYSDDELRRLGLEPFDSAAQIDAIVVQADHAEYADLDQRDFPRCRVILDGRRITTPERWTRARRIVIGEGTPK
jgi:nucleotide sugar dehydrogenase